MYRVLSSSTNITTARAPGFCDRRSMIRSKSLALECRETFSDTAIHIPKLLAIDINDAIPCNSNVKRLVELKIKVDEERILKVNFLCRAMQISVKFFFSINLKLKR